MYPTKNGIPDTSRTQLIALLNARLADAIDLGLSAKQAHWNVKGPHFIALHQLFDSVAEHLEDYVDDLAERVVQLGGIAAGTATVVAERSTLPKYPLSLADGSAHVEALSSAVAQFGKAMRAAIDLASDLKDAATADLFTEISRGLDKDLWFLEAHLHAQR